MGDIASLPRCTRRIAEHLHRDGHEAATAEAMAVNTVRKWCARGSTHNGARLSARSRETACDEVTEIEQARNGSTPEEARGVARLRVSGVTARARERRALTEVCRNRLTLVRGMLRTLRAASPTPLLLRSATTLLEGRDSEREWSVPELREELEQEEVALRTLIEALGYGNPARPAEAPAARPAPAKAKGREGKPVADRAAKRKFEKEHPRAAKGRVGAGKWIQKGAGMGGDPDQTVRQLQERLSQLGYTVPSDGRFGPATEDRLKDFQRDYGLEESGKLDPSTVETLRNPPPKTATEVRAEAKQAEKGKGGAEKESRGAKKAAAKGADGGAGGSDGEDRGTASPGGKGADTGADGGERALARGEGMKGEPSEAVSEIQEALEALGYDLGDGGVDGRFGPDTEAALRRMQRQYGLKVTGTVTAGVRLALKELLHRREEELAVETGRRRPRSALREETAAEPHGIVPLYTTMVGGLRPWGGPSGKYAPAEYPDDRPVERLLGLLSGATAAREAAEAGGDGYEIARARARERVYRARLEEYQESKEADMDLQEVKSAAYPSLERVPGKQNWVDRAGGLPSYIERIAKHLHYEKGMNIGRAIATAVNVVKKMCATGDTNFPGAQQVNVKSRAQACKAVAQWEAKKARSKVSEAADDSGDDEDGDELERLAKKFMSRGMPREAALKAARRALGRKKQAAEESRAVELVEALPPEERFYPSLEQAENIVRDMRAHERRLQEAGMVRCPHCGAKVPEGSKTCRSCGYDLQEAVLTARARKSLAKSDFAIPEKKAYPIHDEAHARNALARVAQHGTEEEKRRVRAAVKRRYPNIEISEAVLSYKARKRLPRSAFAIPPDRYPIHDRAHAANALARSSGKPEEGRVKAAVCRRYPDLPACKEKGGGD